MALQNLNKPKNYSILDSSSITKLTLKLIKRGKKKQVLNLFKDILELLKTNNSTNTTFLTLIDNALINVMPFVQLKTVKKGATSLQFPASLQSKQQLNIAMKWLITAAEKRNEKSFALKFFKEITEAANFQGNAVQLKLEQHKSALNQKRFLYFRK